ncbi:hypothetical protein [Nannocystis radixulma]|uniref:Uncharacterized protein n=1 Tax=Nannocystis radixulma TaxID=2995305 RepID=A0ABT5AXM9_9BACT|nr:hypothetical protein [Nannocystis radixulma]MDC0666597.1 hypothetical protein [Nannocystis radixulma]
MAPEIDHAGWSCTRDAGALLLTHPQRGEVVLLGLAARLFDLADGRRSVAELAVLLEAVPEDIFAALDELADHALLRARVAPPAAVRGHSRREVLGALAGAAAAVATPTLALAAPAPVDQEEFMAREADVKQAAVDTIAEHEANFVAAAPPREQIYKEGTSKAEQQRKLDPGSGQSVLFPQGLAAEENKKAEADLLGAYESAAKRADSPAESAEKQRLAVPPALAGAREAERKQSVASLVAEEEAAKAAAHWHTGRLTGEVAALSEREQHAKLSGDFGPAHEQTHKALLAARTLHRRQADQSRAEQVQQAQKARWQADIAEGRSEEQHDKVAIRAREQARKGQIQEHQVQQAEEQREKHRVKQLEQFRQRHAEHVQARETLAARARTGKEAEQSHKSAAGEESQKHDAVRVELKAREHAAKSRPGP